MAITVTTADNVREDFIPGAKCDGDNSNCNNNSNCAFVDSSGKSCMTTDYGVIVLKRSYRKKPKRQRPTENKMSSSANTSLLLCTTFCQFTAITNWVEKNTGMKEFCGRSSSVLKSTTTTTTTKSNNVRRRRRKKNVSAAAVDTNNNSFVGNDISFLTDISMMDNVIDEEEEEVEKDSKKSNSKKKKMKKKLSLNFRIIKKSFVDYVLKM